MEYGNTVALEQRIDKAYLTTTSKLVELMKSKFGLWDHLNAFKKYILLGQGDFIALLMESIGYSPRHANTNVQRFSRPSRKHPLQTQPNRHPRIRHPRLKRTIRTTRNTQTSRRPHARTLARGTRLGRLHTRIQGRSTPRRNCYAVLRDAVLESVQLFVAGEEG